MFLLRAVVDVQHFSQDLDCLGARTGLRALRAAYRSVNLPPECLTQLMEIQLLSCFILCH